LPVARAIAPSRHQSSRAFLAIPIHQALDLPRGEVNRCAACIDFKLPSTSAWTVLSRSISRILVAMVSVPAMAQPLIKAWAASMAQLPEMRISWWEMRHF
jgi:hypothetical protein